MWQYAIETEKGMYREDGKIKLFPTLFDAINFADDRNLGDPVFRITT